MDEYHNADNEDKSPHDAAGSPNSNTEFIEQTGKFSSPKEIIDLEGEGVSTTSIIINEKTEGPLPLALLPKSWYARRGRLVFKNEQRSLNRKSLLPDSNSVIRSSGLPLPTYIEKIKSDFLGKIAVQTTNSKAATLTGIFDCITYLEENLFASTQVYQKGKPDFLGIEEKLTEMRSSQLMEMLSKYINVAQVYLYGKAYLLIDQGQKLGEFVKLLQNLLPTEKVINDQLMDNLGKLFHTSLKFMDAKKDRDTLKALMAHATSASFLMKWQCIKNRTVIMHCKEQLATNLDIYRQIEITSLTALNDMTNVQQHCLHRRIVNRRKQAEFKTKHETRGRMLKS